MANSSSKGLTIGLVAVVVVLALVFAVARHKNNVEGSPEVATTAASTTKADETKADAAKSEKSDKSDKKEASASSTSSSEELTSSSEETSQTTTAAKTEEAANDKAAEKSDAKPEEKSETKAEDKPADSDSGSLLSGPSALEINIDKATAERAIGKDDAPVTMIEYFSLTCPHCAHFSNDLLPKLKTQLIDTGKLRVIFRDYPLDTYAMKAAMMARCADADKYPDLIEVIFKNQERWVKNADPVKGLIQLGSLAGMNEDYIKSCMADEELQSFILSKVQDAQKNYKLQATPTFVFNNGAEIMSGDKEVEDFVNVVKKLTGK